MNPRIIRALARQGLQISKRGPVYRVRRHDAASDVPTAEVLLPEGFPLEGKALAQLTRFAGVQHPDGGRVCRACATPDFHPGSLVPVGSVVASSDLVIPQAIGTDINCGMRLHVADVTLDRFLAHKHEIVERLRGDLLLGTRDLPSTPEAMRDMFTAGAPGWVEAASQRPLGLMRRADLTQLEDEHDRIYGGGSANGNARWAPLRPRAPRSRGSAAGHRAS